MWEKRLFEALDFRKADNVVEYHLEEDVVDWELQ